MSGQTNPNSKSDPVIQVRVYGDDVYDQRFDELCTAFPTSKGIMLETVHQLREGTSLEIVHILTHRKAKARVKSLGPQLGVSTLVCLEGGDVEDLWIKASTKEAGVRRRDTPEDDAYPMTPTNNATVVAMPDRALMQVPKPRIATMDRFMDTLSELVESALEANLRPAVEQLTNEIPEHIVKTQTSVLANLEEKIQAATGAFSKRLDTQALEIVTRSENLLTQKILESMEEAQRYMKARQSELNQNLEGVLLAGKERLSQQVDGFVLEITSRSRERMQEELSQLEKQFTGRCQALTEERQAALFARAQDVESNLAERLSGKINGILEEVSAEMEKRFEQALIMPMAGIEKRLEEMASALSDRAHQVERDFAGRFHAELQKSFEQDLSGYVVRLQEQLALSASQFRQNFTEQIEEELNEKQGKLVRQVQGLVKDLAERNQNQNARLLKELARAIALCMGHIDQS